MTRGHYKRLVVVLATLMLMMSSVFSGAAIAQRGGGGGGGGGLSADFICESTWTGQFRLVSQPTDCQSHEQLIVVAESMPFDYCVSVFTGIMTDDRPGDVCPRNTTYVVVEDQTSFFVCVNQFTRLLYHMSSPDSPCAGQTTFFTDFRGDITKFACVEENLNLEACDIFPAGPQNEIRQIGPMPHTGGGFGDIHWQWVFDGANSPTQRCIDFNDCDNAEIEAALEALTGHDVSVTGGPIAGTVDAPIRIEFVGASAQTDILPQISIQNVQNTINQTDATVIDGGAASPGLSNVMPGGMVEVYEAEAGTDPGNPATYGPLVTSGPVSAAGSFTATNLLEGDYVVCADGTGSISASCEIVTVFDEDQTIVNNVDLPGTIMAEITDTVGGNEVRSYDDFPFGGGNVDSGQYSITVGVDTTIALDFDADATTIQDALEDLGSVGENNVLVTGGPPPGFGPAVVIEFVGTLAGVDVPDIVINDISLDGGPFAGYFQDPNLTDRDGFGTVQTLTADGRVSGGTFTLTYDNGTISDTTGPLDFDATVNEIEAALNGLASITDGGGSVNVFSTVPNVIPGTEPITKAPVEIQFVNVMNSDDNVLQVDNTSLE